MATDLYRVVKVPSIMRVGAGVIRDAPRVLAESGHLAGRMMVVSGPGPSLGIGKALAGDFSLHAGRECVVETVSAGSSAEAARLAQRMIVEETDLVVAVGGGRVVDTVKYAASRVGRPFICVPTSIAHDGISSPVASLTDPDGWRRSYPASMPAGLIVDTEVITSAPRSTLQAGLGDLLSNISACVDWRMAESRKLDSFDEYSAAIAESAALSAVDITSLADPDQVDTLVKGLLISGLAMATAGSSRPCSGGEHLFSHALDQEPGLNKSSHGLQVAFGSLLTTLAQGKLTDALLEAYARNGLPMHESALGLSTDDVVRILCKAPSTRPERWTILTEVTHSVNAVRKLVGTLRERVHSFEHDAGLA